MIDKKITSFIKKHHVLTLATVDGEGMPYVANCFYAYDAQRNLFIFTSDTTTRHGGHMVANPNVAISIPLETRVVGRVQGIQVCGIVECGDQEARSTYKAFSLCCCGTPNTMDGAPHDDETYG